MIEIWCPGIAKSTQTGSVVRAGKRLIPIRRGTEWASYIKLMAQQHAPPALLEGPLSVYYTFYVTQPKKPKHPHYPVTRPDVDNLLKGISDSLNGIVWQDDSQIVTLSASKLWAGSRGPGLRINVVPCTPASPTPKR